MTRQIRSAVVSHERQSVTRRPTALRPAPLPGNVWRYSRVTVSLIFGPSILATTVSVLALQLRSFAHSGTPLQAVWRGMSPAIARRSKRRSRATAAARRATSRVIVLTAPARRAASLPAQVAAAAAARAAPSATAAVRSGISRALAPRRPVVVRVRPAAVPAAAATSPRLAATRARPGMLHGYLREVLN